MIRLLLIIIFFLLFLWLLLKLFSSKKNDTIKFGLSAKFIILLIVLVGFLFSLKYLPKLLTIFPGLQGIVSPLLGILRSFLPF